MHYPQRLLTTVAALALTVSCGGIGSAIVGGEHRRDAASAVDSKLTDAHDLDAQGFDAPDSPDGSDAPDALDAADVSDVSDALDAADALDALDALDVSDVTDAPDDVIAPDVVDGSDAPVCIAEETLCDGVCVDVRRSRSHCGACGTACGEAPNAFSECEASRCVLHCAPSFEDCDRNPANGCEVHTTVDPLHCGGCGRACSTANGAPACLAGACTVGRCDTGFDDCNHSALDGCETVIAGDINNCGRCGVSCTRPPVGSAQCTAGVCGLSPCMPGRLDCDGMIANGCEVDSTTTAHCGACGRACPTPPHALAVCTLGVCGMGACEAGYADCDSNPTNGCEAHLTVDAASCGACGRACMPAQATGVCAAGSCTISACTMGFSDCDHDVSNGCEINTGTNEHHCGSCGRECVLAHATARCGAGACQIALCDAGYTDCDGVAANGCETRTSSDAFNCGTCGRMCPVPPTGTASCTAGACGVTLCAAGRGNCDGNDANGCETDTTTTSNCGGCGTMCSTPNATPACSSGLCAIGSCNAGRANCDGSVSNGCETDVGTNPSACGSCTRLCMPPANSSPMCLSGDCRFTCSTDFADCNGLAGDGCESYRFSDNNNCGTCGNACGAGRMCAAGACVCDIMSTMCSGACVNTSTDPLHCGSCTTVCAAGQACVAGLCSLFTCTSDGRLCGGTTANVCVDPNNCGACSNACSLTNICMGGVCVPCATGFSRCGNTCRDLNNDSASCGMCGFSCPLGQTCVAGSCRPPGSDAGSD